MNLLTAVNNILPKLGEHPVTSLDKKHPTLAIILPLVDLELERLLTKGWWFNTYPYTMYPDTEGNIAIPTNTLQFTPVDVNAIVRAGKLFNPATLDYVWTEPVVGTIILNFSFDELPVAAQHVVFYQALVAAYVTDLGLEKEVQFWMQGITAAEKLLMSEHLRNRKFSASNSPRHRRLRAAMRG